MRKGGTANKKTLVLGFLENVSSKIFSDYPQPLTDLVGRKHGVYALYKGKRLYYVGLATNLRGRIKQHLRDKHTGKWDKFSIYLIKDAEHIKELETLIMRIADPAGNTMKGKLPSADNLKGDLGHNIRSAQDRRLRELLGRKTNVRSVTRRKGRPGRPMRPYDEPSLAPYIKGRKGSFRIRGVYKDVTYSAKVNKGGTIRLDGKLYYTPTGAGKAARGRNTNGWKFWKYRNKKGEWVPLSELKK